MTAVSPIAGYVSQGYKPRAHPALDIATGGKARVAVVAMFAGTVERIHTAARPGDRASTWAPGRTSNGVIVRNTGPGSSNDNERQAYGHVTPMVDAGERVQAGQLVGYLDNSGQWTGWHLHFETWAANGAPYDPHLAFNAHGLRPGDKPTADTPAPGNNVAQWQSRLNKYAAAGLVVDGVNGPVSKAWRRWVKQLQTELPKWRGIGPLVVDGDYGPVVAAAVRVLQRRNGLVVDGIAGPSTIAYMRKHGSKVPNRPPNRPRGS